MLIVMLVVCDVYCSHLDVWVLEVVGHLIINAVFVAIAINYCTQCQLLICFVRAVLLSIAERSLDLKAVMKVRLLSEL